MPDMDAMGYVYFVTTEDAEAVKIGFATNVRRRLPELQQSAHKRLHVFDAFHAKRRDEVALHHRFRAHRLRGEWFDFSDEIMNFIEDLEEHRRHVFEHAIFNPATHKTLEDIDAELDEVPMSDFVQAYVRGEAPQND